MVLRDIFKERSIDLREKFKYDMDKAKHGYAVPYRPEMEKALKYYKDNPEMYQHMKSQTEKGLVYSPSNATPEEMKRLMQDQKEIIRLMESTK